MLCAKTPEICQSLKLLLRRFPKHRGAGSPLLPSRSIWIHPSSSPPSMLLALSVATGLPLLLWTYKCLMLVVFQRKVIYMGYIPPGARTEELASFPTKEALAEEIRIPTTKKSSLSGIVVSHRSRADWSSPPRTIVFYLQGNAGNPLHRLSIFETLLSCSRSMHIISVAPRSYWKSSPRTPSESGILSDYQRALQYTISRWPTSSIILYGHSLGGTVAVRLAATLNSQNYSNVKGLILENPFASIPKMVTILYPQRWLPYHYLTPFVRDTWDAAQAMEKMTPDSLLYRLSRDMLLILSEKDELVPKSMGSALFDMAEGDGIRRKVEIQNALHENAWQQTQWLTEMRKYITILTSI